MENILRWSHHHDGGLSVHRTDFGAMAGLGGYVWEPYAAQTGGLVWAFEGVMTVHLGDRRWLLTPQHAAVLPAAASGDVVANLPSRAMYIQCPSIGPGAAATRVRLSDRAPELLHEFSRTTDAGAAHRLWQQLRPELTPVGDQGLLLRLPADPRARDLAFALLDRTADHRDSAPRTLEDWSGELHASAKTLQRLFLSETGTTFPRWRARARLNASLVRLSQGVPVQEVAREVGYTSSVGYIDAFRAHFGVTPGAFYG